MSELRVEQTGSASGFNQLIIVKRNVKRNKNETNDKKKTKEKEEKNKIK